jgi:hypothetical protein
MAVAAPSAAAKPQNPLPTASLFQSPVLDADSNLTRAVFRSSAMLEASLWGRTMAIYIFILHSDGEDAERVEIEFTGEKIALETADELSRCCDVDLWQADRLLTTLKRRSPAEALLPAKCA